MWSLLVGALLVTGQDPRLAAAVTLDSNHPFVVPADAESWQERSQQLRRRVLVAAGLWPLPERTEAEVRTLPAIERGDYTVQPIAFESWPGHWVTGSLYRPTGPGPFAGVLCPHGHWSSGRFSERSDDEVASELRAGGEQRALNARYHLQARCATLARLGCVVLHFDMVGYADSRTLPHGAGFGDAEALLWGQSALGLQTWNSIRALDILAGLEGVDEERLGVTGGSGGGTQTFLLGAVDPRPAALAPAVMVSTGMQGGCVCENAPHLRIGCGNVELAALSAPRPLALIGADDWTRDIERQGLPELRQLYRLLNYEDHLSAWVHLEFEHNYNAVSRAHVYRFFDRHLELGQALDRHPLRSWALEERFVPLPPTDLAWGDAVPKGLELAALRTGWKQRQAQRIAEAVPRNAGALAAWQNLVAGALEILIPAAGAGDLQRDVVRGAIGPSWEHITDEEGRRVRLRMWRRDEDTPVRGTLLWVGEAISPEAWERHPARVAWRAGWSVVEVRTLLEDEPGSLPVDSGRHGWYAGYTWTYNRTLLAERCRDLGIAVRFLRQQLPSDRPLVCYGTGWAGPGALLAAARNPQAFDRIAVSWDWNFADIEELQDPRLLPGALAMGGMEGLGSAYAPRPLALVGPPLPAVLSRVWNAHGAAAALRSVPDRDAALRWLLEPL